MGLLSKLFGRGPAAAADDLGPIPPGDAGEFVKAARSAWRAGDFDRARLMYQKSAYAASIIRDAAVKEQVNATLKSEQAKYVTHDPLFSAIVSAALGVIRSSPGILQSKIYEQLPYDRELAQWALYYAEVLGRVRREKKGRSYVLSAPAPD